MLSIRRLSLFSLLSLSALAVPVQAQYGVSWYVPDYAYYPNYYGLGPTIVPNSGYYGPYGWTPGIRAYGTGWYPGYGGLGGLYYGERGSPRDLASTTATRPTPSGTLADARQVDAQTRASRCATIGKPAGSARTSCASEQALSDAIDRSQQVHSHRRGRRPTSSMPKTATIQWPPVLREDNFAAARGEVEQLFSERLKTGKGGEGTLNYLEIRTAVGKVRDELESQAGQIDDDHWIAANQFLNRW